MKHSLHTVLGLNVPEEAIDRLQSQRSVLPSHENIALWTRGLNMQVLDVVGIQWLYYLEQLSFAIISLQVFKEREEGFMTSDYQALPGRLKAEYTRIVDIFENTIRECGPQEPSSLSVEIQEAMKKVKQDRRVKALADADVFLKEFDHHSIKNEERYLELEEEIQRRLALVEQYASYQFFQRLSDLAKNDVSLYEELNLAYIRSIQNAIAVGDLELANELLKKVTGLSSVEPASVDVFLRTIEARVSKKLLQS